jgi:hypothetical protein
LNRQEQARQERLGFTDEAGVEHPLMPWDRKCELTLKFDRARYRINLFHRMCEEAECDYTSKPGKRLKRGCVYRTFKMLQDLWGETGHSGTGVELPMPDRNHDGTYPYHQPKGIVRQECDPGQPRGEPFSARQVEKAIQYLLKHRFIARASGGNGRGRKSRFYNPRYAVSIDREKGNINRQERVEEIIRLVYNWDREVDEDLDVF